MIKEMKLKPKTEALLGLIYMKYWADEEEREKFQEKIKEEEEILSKEEKIGFENNIFKEMKKEQEEVKQKSLLQEYKKEKWFSQMIDRIKKFLRR